MNKQEQIKFIEDNYPATISQNSQRRVRHTFFSKIETELQAYLLGFYTADGKTTTLITDIQRFLSENNINTNIIYLKRDDMWRINTGSKKECIKLYHFLYDDANFYLSRKFNKFSHYVNTEEIQLIAELRNAQEVNVNESNNLPTSAEHPTSEGENIC